MEYRVKPKVSENRKFFKYPVTYRLARLYRRIPPENVVLAAMPIRQDIQTRIRKRIRARLDEKDMTARELARAVGHDDAWISGVLSGAHGLHWKDFDAVADKLEMSPSELVRHDDAEVREITPSEMKLLRHYQQWPRDMQESWLALLDFFTATIPDRQTADFLGKIQAFPPSFRRPLLNWFSGLLQGNIPLEEIIAGAGRGSTAGASESETTHLTGLERTPHDDLIRGDGPVKRRDGT